MGLFDSVLGAVAGQLQGNAGLQDLLGAVGNNPQLMQLAASLLSNEGAAGGLNGLVAKFQQAGLGDVVASWIGSGQNQHISPEQLGNVLGNDTLAGLASQVGLSGGDAAQQLAGLLPGMVDALTPGGSAPAEGLGDATDLLGSLGALLKA
ncbi:MAG: YidB family protein [Burkholderiales bacterium]|nr:YidB family protein [Burkholderiales bacterium]